MLHIFHLPQLVNCPWLVGPDFVWLFFHFVCEAKTVVRICLVYGVFMTIFRSCLTDIVLELYVCHSVQKKINYKFIQKKFTALTHSFGAWLQKQC